MNTQYICDLLMQKRHQINCPGYSVPKSDNQCKLCGIGTGSSVINVCDACYEKPWWVTLGMLVIARENDSH